MFHNYSWLLSPASYLHIMSGTKHTAVSIFIFFTGEKSCAPRLDQEDKISVPEYAPSTWLKTRPGETLGSVYMRDGLTSLL